MWLCQESPKKRSKGSGLVSQSSDVRYANVQFYLGSVHANGKDVDKDETEAKYWYCRAAEQVHTNVQCHLRLVCANGKDKKWMENRLCIGIAKQ